MLNVEPLHMFIEAKARYTALRLHHFSMLINQNYGHANLWNTMIKFSPELTMPCDEIYPIHRFENKFNVSIPSRDDWKLNPPDSNGDSLNWYSDGSRYKNMSGSGYQCAQLTKEISKPLGKYATVSQTEILGILGCCLECVADNFSNRSVCIYSDSQATLKALVNRKLSSSLLLECRDMIQLL